MEDYILNSVLAAQILTNSYVASSAVDLKIKYNKLIVLLNITLGSLTSVQYKLEFSPDGTNWYQETASAVSGTTSTDSLLEHSVSATGNYRLVLNMFDRYVRVSVKGTGTVTSSSITVNAITGDSEN
jgi:hypothetical protein